MEETLDTVSALDAGLDAAFDAAWDEEDAAEAGMSPAEDRDGQQEQRAEERSPAQESGRPKGGTAGADQLPAFTLKHLDETRTVGRDEVVKLAQQGMDYERIRTERDQLRAYRSENNPALALVKSLAEKSGMSTADYVDFCRRQTLTSSGISQQNAQRQIAAEKRQSHTTARQADGMAAQQQRAEARKTEMTRFLRTFPNVKPEAIPKEVWKNVVRGEGLTSAYAMYRNRQLETDLAAERQNRVNAQKTTGSLFAGGAGIRQSELDRWWNDDD